MLRTKLTDITRDTTYLLTSLILVLLLSMSLSACTDQQDSEYTPTTSKIRQAGNEPIYIFSIHPLHNPNRLHEIFDPMMDYLSNNIENATFKLEASRNYAAYNKKLYAGKADFSLPNPYQTITSLRHGYKVFGKMGDDENFRGIILVRKDSGISAVEQLKGKAVSYPAPTALAATMLPQYYLQSNGINVMQDIENRYVGSQESSIMNVYLGNVAAGATWPPPWNALSKERPELKETLEIKWQTQSLPNNGLVVHKKIPDSLTHQVSELLFNMHKTKEGKHILEKMELSQFERANNETYQPVLDFLEKFRSTVRPVE